MATKDDGGPAFPSEASAKDMAEYGMSLRDYFAANAPPPPKWWLTSYKSMLGTSLEVDAQHDCQWRYVWADAMLKARST